MSLTSRFRSFVGEVSDLQNAGGRKDSVVFQAKVSTLLKELNHLENFINQLHLFSDNETLEEINPVYIQYLNVNYFFARLYNLYLLNPKSNSIPSQSSLGKSAANVDPVAFKSLNLELCKTRLINFLLALQSFKALSEGQSKRLNSFKEILNPTYDELVTSSGTNPATKRAEKIENYKLEKELTNKLQLLDDYYKSKPVAVKNKNDNEEDDDDDDDFDLEEDDDDIFTKFDEETLRAIYQDQLKLNALSSFNMLESTVMELEVLSKRPPPSELALNDQRKSSFAKGQFGPENDYGYTTKLENVYNPNAKGNEKASQLVSKQGKILQPFTITSNRQDLNKKVRGTGQVLPSMSVEEYLDYELANGKMVKEEAKDVQKDEDESDNSDEELEKRNWDDWKDDNPKGSGNTGGNIG
ncbi:type 2A phosphatase-associated protein 42 [[Candida] railenensis]|uniref:Type 2A phosphatase-associated protein 42 n=1 Tax=[Candida] railenensis TaxID=45579 RepID=A0A9P0QNC0_9ASCO|nr:type 2A phosphatase-associated protein 42 [[Candida] railenensis]